MMTPQKVAIHFGVFRDIRGAKIFDGLPSKCEVLLDAPGFACRRLQSSLKCLRISDGRWSVGNGSEQRTPRGWSSGLLVSEWHG